MLTRLLYLSAGWFAISFISTLLFGLRLRRGHFLISLGWLLTVLLLGDLWAYLTFGVPREMVVLSGVAFIQGIIFILLLRDWNAIGQVTWSMAILSTVIFSAYAFQVTAFTPLNAISFLLAFILYFLETAALLLALTHTFESLDNTMRIRWKRRIERLAQVPGYSPMVSLHVPTYNEPPEVVEGTLRSLADLDYPNYEVLVVDNNTPEEDNWRSIEALCRQLGPRFHFLHLDKWPGYKSGALNFALAQTTPEAEIIGSIDSDYRLDPSFLRELVPAFTNPAVAFIQTPQDYRDYEGDPYTESTYHGYKYFFEVSMPSRNERNAIIFAGTMGLIRKSALQEIGGWDEWCITEDAEASLRILKRGYQALYLNHSFGYGLMPFTFDGLKKQRFRWCFGGIQILKKHWESLMPWARWVDPSNHLSPAQRYYYLVGGLQWYTDLLNLLFSLFLVLGAVFSLLSSNLTIRPLTGPLLVMPAVFLLLHLWRFIWVLRHTLHLSWRVALRSMYNFFSMGWAVTLASLQGWIQREGVFLRTPKSRSPSRFIQAIRATQWETLIGTLCLTAGISAFLVHPNLKTFLLGVLLLWQSSLYLAAPYYSLLSVYRKPAVSEIEVPRVPVQENWAAKWALALVAVLALVAGVAQLIPQPKQPPAYSVYQPADIPPKRLVGLDQVPLGNRATPPTPTATLPPTATSPVIALTGTPPPTPAITLTPDLTGTPGLTETRTVPAQTTPTPAPTLPLPSITPTQPPITPTLPLTTPLVTHSPTLADPPTATPTLPPLPSITPTLPPLPTVTPTLPLVDSPNFPSPPLTPALPAPGLLAPDPSSLLLVQVPLQAFARLEQSIFGLVNYSLRAFAHFLTGL